MEGEFSLLSKLLTSGVLEQALSRYFTRSEPSREILLSLAGKVIGVSAPPLVPALYLFPTPSGLQLGTAYLGVPDLMLTGTPLAFAKLGARGVQRRDLFSGEIEISGDVRLAEVLQRLFEASELRWQRVLGGISSPLLVEQVTAWGRAAAGWSRGAAGSLQQDLGEFLREEVREVPTASEAEEFLAAVDRLRDDGDRLDARIDRLQRTLTTHRPQLG